MEQSEALQILGLSATATHQDARSSWRVLAKTHHPDVGGSEINMARINQALETILDMQEPVVEKKALCFCVCSFTISCSFSKSVITFFIFFGFSIGSFISTLN